MLVDTSRVYGRELIRGIIKYAKLHDPWNFHSDLPFFGKTSPAYRWETLKLDGIIAHIPNKRLIKEVIKADIPTIVRGFERPIQGLPNFVTDNVLIAKFAAEHLLNRGFRYLAFCGYRDILWSQERETAFESIVSEAGYQVHVYQPPRAAAKRSWQQEQKLLSEWIRSLPKPIGIMGANDDRGQHVIEVCNELGLLIPDEVAVVGVDNDEFICDLTNPPLSSVSRYFTKAGYEAAELLYKMMRNKRANIENIIVRPSHVVSRQSTDVFSIEDPVVVEALRFIRRNANRAISVDDVVEQLAMSKRGLYQKFMHTMGHTVHEEIIRVRTEKIARMLEDTELTITQIALDLGFPGPDHISRYFKMAKGMTPRQYRMRYKYK